VANCGYVRYNAKKMIDQGTASRYHKDKHLKLGYFDASITCLSSFKYGKDLCPFCKTEQTLFTINPKWERGMEYVCLECLKAGQFNFTHNTDYGLVVNEDIPDDVQDIDASKKVNSTVFSEMLHTPNYSSMQGEEWKCHCNDFMDYKGTWEAPDFTRNSPTGNGKELFLSMAGEINNLWDDFELKDDETESTWSEALFHIFECRHCKIKLGYWEV
jgi:uncharacterized protein CbrC (UPF0167 family)